MKDFENVLKLKKIEYNNGMYIIEFDNISPDLKIKKIVVEQDIKTVFIHVKLARLVWVKKSNFLEIKTTNDKDIYLAENNREKRLFYSVRTG